MVRRKKDLRAVTLRSDDPKSWAHAVRPRHCPQATSARPIPTDVLFVDKPVRHAQGYPTSFHKAVEFEEKWVKFRYRPRGFGVAPIFLQNAVDRLSLRRHVDARPRN